MDKILGMVQGLTEFLPVSSSGHLVFLSQALNINVAGVHQIALLHLGTFLAVFLFSFRVLRRIFHNLKVLINLIISTIPAALAGVLFEEKIDAFFSRLEFLPAFFSITAVVLSLTKNLDGKKCLTNMTWGDALLVGLAQALAILPGVSRSGVTVSTLLFLGLKRSDAVQYSFLMSLPVILGAGLLSLKEVSFAPSPFLLSFSFGLVALMWLARSVKSGDFWKFSYYCLFMAVVSYFVG